MAEPLLSVTNLRAGYGDGVVIEGLSFSLPRQGSLALLGRNGMGKTTTILSLMGHTRVWGGTMMLDGRSFGTASPHHRQALGLGWVPQERDIFPSLTVEENLTVAARRGLWDLVKVYNAFPRLRERKRNYGNQLSGGEQQMLAVGRALIGNPKILLLDEPFEGLAPIIVDELAQTIRGLRSEDMGIVLVEQHIDYALSLSDDVIILEQGAVAHFAKSAEISAEPQALHRLLALT